MLLFPLSFIGHFGHPVGGEGIEAKRGWVLGSLFKPATSFP